MEFALAGAAVTATPAAGGAPAGEDETSAAGEYAITALPTGLYDLDVSLEGYEAATEQADLGTGGEDFVTVDFALVAKTSDVGGTVRDGGGNTISGATVEAVLLYGAEEKVIATGTTDGEGAYSLPQGAWRQRAGCAERIERW